MNQRFTILVCLASLTITIFSLYHIQIDVQGETVRTPGVSVGDSIKYGNFSAKWSPGMDPAQFIKDFNNTMWMQNTVLAVSGTNITYEFKWRFKNGTDFILLDWIDVNSGGNPSGLGYTFPFFISKNLQANDSIYNVTSGPWVGWMINETIQKEYLGVNRKINHIDITLQQPSITYHDNLYWDQSNGTLMERDILQIHPEGTIEIHFEIVSTSISSYTYEIELYGESYYVNIETDGIIGTFDYTNYTFSIGWDTLGTYENITLPRALNNTNIQVMLYWYIQGLTSPEISANATHYFIWSPETGQQGRIKKVIFGAPDLKLSLSTPTTYLSFYLNITGNVTYRENPVSNVGVYISWGSSMGSNPSIPFALQNFISLVNTDAQGRFSTMWMPTSTGTFWISAGVLPNPWDVDEAYPMDHSADFCCLAVAPFLEQYVFSVTSNSTISALAFNSTTNELSFSAEGPTGTTGYAKVFISKELVANISDLRVYIDGNLTDFTAASTDSSWLLHFTYPHSTHNISIVIPEFSTLIIVPSFMIATLAALFLRRKKT